MLSKLIIELKSEKPISYNMSSLFHGAMMEQLENDFVQILHSSSVNPFSMHLDLSSNSQKLIINTLTKEAYDQIIHNRMEKLEGIYLKHNHTNIEFVQKEIYIKDRNMFWENFYDREHSGVINVEFLTPTAFKQNGKYQFLPDIRCIYQSLMNKYDDTDEKFSFQEEEVLEELVKCTTIGDYYIRSKKFHMEGVRISGFIGKVSFRIKAPQPLINLSNILFEFGTYSGIGIKTSLGMGAIKINQTQ